MAKEHICSALRFRDNPSDVFRLDTAHMNPHTTSSGISTFYVARRIQDYGVVMVNILPIHTKHALHELLGSEGVPHPNIVSFIEYYQEDDTIKWLILDHIRGDWLNNLVARTSLYEDHVARIATDVCAGLNFLHGLGFILRTVKTDGVFLTQAGEVIICDLENLLKLDDSLSRSSSHTKLVAPHWMPPEVARGQEYTIQTDTWSLGIMIIEMIDKVPPHYQEVPKEVLRRVAVEPSPALTSPTKGSSVELHEFLEESLCISQQKRPSVKELSKHKFLLSACPGSSLAPLLRHKFRPVSLNNKGPKDLTGQVTRSSLFAAIHGGFSDVWLGTYNLSELAENKKVTVPVAIKVLRSVTPDPATHRKIQKRLNKELSVWNILRHPNIVELYGVCSGMSLYSAMVSPWYRKGSAPEFLKSLGDDATLYVRLRLLTDVAAGLEYLHRFTPTVVHGDLKGANVLISEDDDACLCDFGLSTIVGEVAGSSNFTSTFAGSLRWMAPELIQPSEGMGEAPHVTTWSDIYALGSVTYELLTGLVPYNIRKNDVQVMFDVIQGIKPQRPSPAGAVVTMSDTHWKFIERCWHDNPLDRPPISVAAPVLESLYCEVKPPWHMSVSRRREQSNTQAYAI